MGFLCSEHYLYDLPNKYFKKGNKNLFFLDYLVWKKRKFWKEKIFYIVTPSQWLSNLVKKLPDEKLPMSVIPYSVDNRIYLKNIKNLTVNNISLTKNKKYIDILLISAEKLFNYRKGFDLLDNAIDQHKNKKQIRIILVGKFNEVDKAKIKSNFIMLNEVNNEKKAQIYNFVDLLALPSRLDNLPNVGLEAHSCGTPIVAFKVGGIPEIVKHKNRLFSKSFFFKEFY